MKNLMNKRVLFLIFALLFLSLLTGCFLLPPKNQDPVITSTPITEATIEQIYTYNVEANDPDGDPLTYTLLAAPTGMEISPEGVISWNPVATGSYEVTVEVSDGKVSITQTFTIVVSKPSTSQTPSSPSTPPIEEMAAKILETQDLGREYFEQLESQGDPDALQKTINYLKTQPNVDNAEVGEDGISIRVIYKSSVEGVILTEPFRSLGNFLPLSKSYRSTLLKKSADKKAIMLLPFDSVKDYEDKSVDEISSSLQQSGYSENSIETYRGKEVTVDLMETLSNYDFIYMSTHGGVGSSGLIDVSIGQEVNVSSIVLLWNSLTGDSKEILIASIPAKFWIFDIPRIVFALNSRFFAHYIYPESFVYMNACSSLKNDSLADAFLNNGASVYIGWDNTSFLDCVNLHNPEFFEELTKPNKTVQQAYDSTLAKYYPATVYEDTNNNKKWHVAFLNGEDYGDSSDTTVDYLLNIKYRGNGQFILNPLITPETYTITATAGPNGSISPSGDITVNHGSDQSFTITPNIGYIVEDVMVDGSSVGAVDVYTFTNITQNHTISATFSTIETTVEDYLIEFEDPNLEQVIRDEINKPEGTLYVSDVIGITTLIANEREIISLEGIQHLENLQELNFRRNSVSDISPLANLTNLRILDFVSNEVSDISPLANLTNLQALYFWYNEVSDISPLANLTNLQALYFNGLVSDISSLANLTNLWYLSIGPSYITDISPLANLTNLRILDFVSSEVSDISPLANLTNLDQLCLENNQISNISPLANLTNLTLLAFSDNQVFDISPLANLTNLDQLYLANNQISNISPLANLTSLQELVFFNNQVSDISSLVNMTNLERLEFHRNQVTDISALVSNSGLGSGDTIDMRYNYLDLTDGSQSMQDIETLINRGVSIDYIPQRTP